MKLCQEFGSARTGCGRFLFFFLLFWENARKKKVPTDPRETSQRVVSEKKTLVT